jgi:hypothetical protein
MRALFSRLGAVLTLTAFPTHYLYGVRRVILLTQGRPICNSPLRRKHEELMKKTTLIIIIHACQMRAGGQ